jgi:hypothetical protein
MTAEQFLEEQRKKSKIDYGICPPPTTSEEAFKILTNYFLGEDWFTTLPAGQEQVNTEIIVAILEKTQPKSFLQRLFNF